MTKEPNLPRYSIIGPPFISDYGLVDDWKSGNMTILVGNRYQTRAKAERAIKILNEAQAIKMGKDKP